MSDQQLGPSRPDTSATARRRKRTLIVTALALLVLLPAGAASYWLVDRREDDDPGVIACHSAGVLVQAERGENVAFDEVTTVGRLFQNSKHDDLKDKGVLAAGFVHRAQDPRRDPTVPGADLPQRRLSEVIPQLVEACKNHGASVED
ncbi:hypothetical protein [Micromonospora sp. L31]|uniref:hypothetical protein n=1 Tax=Micromonospora sp. L31 TaxID=3452213 RepID=UPI003F8BF3DF